jgi:hypothetical protein
MITCVINGMAAYPAASQSIKLTYANQYVTDDGEYSYDINFPMSIMDNRRVFHNVSRFDVSKVTQKFNDCKLYVSGRLILSGVGTIISVTEAEIKLQIVGGKSRIKFNDKLTKHYIDEIPFGTADKPGYTIDKGFSQGFKNQLKIKDIYRLNENHSEFLGAEGRWCFMPVRDETNDLIANFVGVDKTKQFIGYNAPFIMNLAVQPSLMYIFRKVVEYEGYTLKRNDFDCKPWNQLYIASAYKTRELRRALPHWSSYTFIEEFRKFFNASIYFDEAQKTCCVISSSELSSVDSIEIEPLDEYSADYDEDGSFSSSSTANLEGWSEKKKRQTIIEHFYSYYIYVEEDNTKTWQLAGYWSPLIRDQNSDDYVDLCISPAAQVVEDINFKTAFVGEDNHYEKRCLLSIPNDKEADSKECDVDDDGYSYISVQDAIDDESSMEESEDEEEVMSVFFILPGKVQAYDKPYGHISWVGNKSRWPMFITDYRINTDYQYAGVSSIGDTKLFSLSLNSTNTGVISLGKFHNSVIKIDNRNCMEVKFKSDVIPDPSKIYIIRNKKFVCEKIELEIKNDDIEPIYTGYFYMMS